MNNIELVKENEINMLDVRNGIAYIRTYDSQMGTLTETILDGLEVKKVKVGKIFLSKKAIQGMKELLKKGGYISIDDKLIVSSQDGQAKFQYAIEEIDGEIELDGQALACSINSLKKASKFVSLNNKTRVQLTGVNVKSDGMDMIIQATDSFKLYHKKEMCEGSQPVDVIIPSSFIDLVQDDMKLFFTDKTVIARNENQVIVSKLIQGNYPNTSRLVEKNGELIEINIQEARNTLKLAQKIGCEVILFDKGIVYSRSQENEFKKEIDILPKIAVTIDKLISCLDCFNEKVDCYYQGNCKPLIVCRDDETTLCLPVKIEGEE